VRRLIFVMSLLAVVYCELYILFIVSLYKIVHKIIVGARTNSPSAAGNEVTFVRPAATHYSH
jgi:hypothetical protein